MTVPLPSRQTRVGIDPDLWSISSGTNSTVSGLPGHGRTLGTFLSWGGRLIEIVATKASLRYGAGPTRLFADIVAPPRLRFKGCGCGAFADVRGLVKVSGLFVPAPDHKNLARPRDWTCPLLCLHGLGQRLSCDSCRRAYTRAVLEETAWVDHMRKLWHFLVSPDDDENNELSLLFITLLCDWIPAIREAVMHASNEAPNGQLHSAASCFYDWSDYPPTPMCNVRVISIAHTSRPASKTIHTNIAPSISATISMKMFEPPLQEQCSMLLIRREKGSDLALRSYLRSMMSGRPRRLESSPTLDQSALGQAPELLNLVHQQTGINPDDLLTELATFYDHRIQTVSAASSLTLNISGSADDHLTRHSGGGPFAGVTHQTELEVVSTESVLRMESKTTKRGMNLTPRESSFIQSSSSHKKLVCVI